MDIRKFFTPPSKKPKLHEDESSTKPKKKKTHKRKGVLFDSDSDDEDPIPKNVKKQLNSSDVIANSGDEVTASKRKSKKKKMTNTSKEKLKETTPSAFFEQFKTNNPKPSVKRKASNDNAQTKPKISKQNTDEVVIIDDDLEEIVPKPKPQKSKSQETVSRKLAEASSRRNNKKERKTDQKENVERKEITKVLPKRNIIEEDTTTVKKPPPITTKQEKPAPHKSVEIDSSNKKNGSRQSESNNKVTPERDVAPELERTDSGSSKKEKFLKYQQWQNRSGPSAPGSKEVPQGKSYCFEGLVFVITGVQESLTRDEIRSLVERYGGKVTGSVSSRTSYVITGVDAGETKIKKAQQHRTKIISEDEFLDLLRTLPGKKSKYEVYDESPKNIKVSKTKHKSGKVSPKQELKKEESKLASGGAHSQSSQESCSSLTASQKPVSGETDLMWVDKYKPKTIKQIIGQQGPNSNMQKLLKWLRDWHSNHRTAEGKARPKPKINMWGGGDPTGASLKAALLSGPPGVGKTTTATLVCKELGLPYVELNASDQRSKKILKEEVFASVQNTSISNLLGREGHPSSDGSQHVLIMDEVDGMAGNEDRGGMQELIQIIKSTKIPIICMCNDRSSQKVRSLANHCFDLRFQRPRVEQITSSIMSICYKEGVTAQAPAIQAIIRGCNQDIRQVLHNLNVLKTNNASLSYDDAKSHADHSQKDVNLGIFDIARKLLSSETANMSLLDKSNLFFMDYSMVPKFVQENYVHVTPFAAQGNARKQLEILSKTADVIANGDLIESAMRREMTWSMLPTLGLMSTVLPCDFMRGSMRGMINFPAFFGKLSTTGKNHRLLQELKFHSSVSTDGSTEKTFNLDLVPYLRWHLSRPLLEQSRTGETQVTKVTQLLDDYALTKEDFDNLMEIGQFQGKANYMSQVDSKVKSAFTRTYNKAAHFTPYAVESAAAKKKRKTPSSADTGFGDEVDSQEDNSVENEDNDDMGQDGMIKEVKKKPSAHKGRSKKDAPGPSKSKRGKKK